MDSHYRQTPGHDEVLLQEQTGIVPTNMSDNYYED